MKKDEKYLCIGKSIYLLNKLDLEINKESIALICAIKKIGREINRPMWITVNPLNDGKLIKVNNVSLIYLGERWRSKSIHDALKEVSRYILGKNFLIRPIFEDLENNFFWKAFGFPECAEDIMRKVLLHYYKEYLMSDDEEIKVMIIGNLEISDEFKKIFLENKK